jgi:ATP-dependent helicase HrpB
MDISKFNLPVADIFPKLEQALNDGTQAIVIAPPGAGKTTLIPLFLMDAKWRNNGIIIMLEPRRLAARSAANRMAQMLSEEVGQTIGYRVRLDQKTSKQTRILVVTEGVFVRMVLDDPELKNISCVVFDEFHERSLDADFGLALALDVQKGLRPDLRLVVMSATLDGAEVRKILKTAPLLESMGKNFPVEIFYEPPKPQERLTDTIVRCVLSVIKKDFETENTEKIRRFYGNNTDILRSFYGYFTENQNACHNLLVFLPGVYEIQTVYRALEGKLPKNIDIYQLHSGISQKDQDKAIAPCEFGHQKIVLSTSIAQTSLTIQGVNCVIDSGLSRVPRYDPASGITRLETINASKSTIAQRSGRAGRTQSGCAIRLWSEAKNGVFADQDVPEILNADLSNLLLDLANFGIFDPNLLCFLTPPPKIAHNEAQQLLQQLGAFDVEGRLTKHGNLLRSFALPVRLSHMMIKASEKGNASQAAEIATVLTERGLGGTDVDLYERLQIFRTDPRETAKKARILVEKLKDQTSNSGLKIPMTMGEILLYAFPDRLAKSRGEIGKFILSNGRGVELDPSNPLSKKDYLVVADLQGTSQKSKILSAVEVTLSDIEAVLSDKIQEREEIIFDDTKKSLRRFKVRNYESVIFDRAPLSPPIGKNADQGLIEAVKKHGIALLELDDAALNLKNRLNWLYKNLGSPWPDVSDLALIERLDEWLLPFLNGKHQMSAIDREAIYNGLRSLIPYDYLSKINGLAPTHFLAPTGNNHPIHYDAVDPMLSIRVQELFGLTAHPCLNFGKTPLLLELLSPAHRPIQLTKDLVGFWQGSWHDVRSDLRGRYPRHFWPENPATAVPTARAKPRGT